jgi:hypothetical protein
MTGVKCQRRSSLVEKSVDSLTLSKRIAVPERKAFLSSVSCLRSRVERSFGTRSALCCGVERDQMPEKYGRAITLCGMRKPAAAQP